MEEIIKVNIDGERQTTSARTLWEFLEKPWGEFIKWFNQFKDYGFIENVDFRVFERLSENPQGGRPSIDYEITIDMAKELAMLQKTEKGKQARQYFIEVEKQLKQILIDERIEERKTIGDIAKKKRVNFTDVLIDHHVRKQHEFIQLTRQMKASLDIDPKKKKPDCNSLEVMKIAIAEDLASLGVMMNNADGYYECKGISLEAANKVKEIASKNNLKLTFANRPKLVKNDAERISK